MTFDLGSGRSITVNSFNGKTWVTNSANGGGTSNGLGEKDALAIAAAIIASVHANRKSPKP